MYVSVTPTNKWKKNYLKKYSNELKLHFIAANSVQLFDLVQTKNKQKVGNSGNANSQPMNKINIHKMGVCDTKHLEEATKTSTTKKVY